MNFTNKLKGKNLILGLASNYNYPTLKPFLQSLKNTGFSGDVVWFINSITEKDIKKIQDYGVITIPYEQHHPYFQRNNILHTIINEKNYPPNSLRFIFYKAFLDKHKNLYEKILHADTRDVYFQDDIFSKPWKDSLYCFLEDESASIASDKFNSHWIRQGFGEKVLLEIGHNKISCCGVTYGSNEKFTSYVDKMCNLITSIDPETGMLEQGVHNYLIYKNLLDNVILVDDDEGEVSTITTFKPKDRVRLDIKKRVINKCNRPVSIVHQYDRSLKLLWLWNKYIYFKKICDLSKKRTLQLLKKYDRKSHPQNKSTV